MKKQLLLLLALLMSVLSISAKGKIKLDVDKVDSDGTRTIWASYFNAYTEWSTAGGMRVGAIEVTVDNMKVYQYVLGMALNEGGVDINEGNKLLLKLENGEVVTLETQVNAMYKPTQNYMTYPIYDISEEQLLKLATNNVIKLRIETSSENLDKTIKGNKVSNGIKESVPVVKAALKEKKDIYSDF